jgi:methylaspartate mutase sigma subunit
VAFFCLIFEVTSIAQRRTAVDARGTAKGMVVTGVIGEDTHSIGIKILELTLTAAGFKVVPLGIQVSQEEYVNAAIETNADAIFVSSLNGHAPIACQGLREKCIEAGLAHVLLYIGGMLLMRDKTWPEIETLFKDMGFNRVYPPSVLPNAVIKQLEADLKL